MVTCEKKQIFIDGKPVFLLSGELHYFRQPPENWQHLIDEAKAMGLNCISSYVPWILHEEREGEWRFEGRLDLGAFIDLCRENELYFFVRPGPFIMAEMKREGIPYWVAEKHPAAVPVGFDGALSGGTTLDYLEPGYLSECRKWYRRVMPIIAPRLHCNGGNIIGVQLDNEIGMLNWVTNQPLLNDAVLERFAAWLKAEYQPDALARVYPFDLESEAVRRKTLRSPQESYAVPFHLDFGRFLRGYYAEYVRILRGYAEENGIRDTPFFINIHGTGSGRIFDYPLGVSQLYQSYNQDDGYISGTDVYLGDPIEGTYQDMYVANAITACMNKRQSPLTSIEFGCSDGPYSSPNGMRIHPAGPSQQTLLCLSQNARMLNYYVFSGGENYLLNDPREDGNKRIAFTGELHGGSAPVQPDGTHNYSYRHLAQTAKTIHAISDLIASSFQETDGVTMAYIPDYFLTEMQYPDSAAAAEVFRGFKRWRCAGAIDSVARGLLSLGISFDAADIQNEDIPAAEVLVVLSARYMPEAIQQKLCGYLTGGGRVFLYGELPEYDLSGRPCTLLLDALGLPRPEYLEDHAPQFFLTIACCGGFCGAAAALRADSAQCFPMTKDAILTPCDDTKMCGFLRSVGKGTLCAVTAGYPADLSFYARVWQELRAKASLRAPYYRQGIYLAKTASADGQRLLYLLNLDAEEKTVDVFLDDKLLFSRFYLAPKASHILPLGVRAAGCTIVSSTAEITGITENSICFLPIGHGGDCIVLETTDMVEESDDYTLTKQDGQYTMIPIEKKISEKKEITVTLRHT